MYLKKKKPRTSRFPSPPLLIFTELLSDPRQKPRTCGFPSPAANEPPDMLHLARLVLRQLVRDFNILLFNLAGKLKDKTNIAPTNEKGSNYITDDLVLSILSKLPLKSLKRFTCVKKSFAHLFDNPNFMSMYRHNFIYNYDDENSCLLLKQEGSTSQDHACKLFLIPSEMFNNWRNLEWPLALTFNDGAKYSYLVSSGSGIHGTLCICTLMFPEFGSAAVVWNPATRESLIVPTSSLKYPYNSHNRSRNILCGFGYDHVRADYKVIQCKSFLFFDDRVSIDVWEIYSVKSNTWRKLDVNMPRPYRNNVGTDAYLNGVCHWKGLIYGKEHLVSFDLSTEIVRKTPFPVDQRVISEVVNHLAVLNGSIALISRRRAVANASFQISILGEIGVEESWTRLFTFGPLPCFNHFIGVGKKGDLIFIKEDEKDADDGKLVCFNLITQMVEEMSVKGKLDGSQIMIYKESLLPIRGINN